MKFLITNNRARANYPSTATRSLTITLEAEVEVEATLVLLTPGVCERHGQPDEETLRRLLMDAIRYGTVTIPK